MEVATSSETLVSYRNPARYHNPEHISSHPYRSEVCDHLIRNERVQISVAWWDIQRSVSLAGLEVGIFGTWALYRDCRTPQRRSNCSCCHNLSDVIYAPSICRLEPYFSQSVVFFPPNLRVAFCYLCVRYNTPRYLTSCRQGLSFSSSLPHTIVTAVSCVRCSRHFNLWHVMLVAVPSMWLANPNRRASFECVREFIGTKKVVELLYVHVIINAFSKQSVLLMYFLDADKWFCCSSCIA